VQLNLAYRWKGTPRLDSSVTTDLPPVNVAVEPAITGGTTCTVSKVPVAAGEFATPSVAICDCARRGALEREECRPPTGRTAVAMTCEFDLLLAMG
jgi:hypothetical protein